MLPATPRAPGSPGARRCVSAQTYRSGGAPAIRIPHAFHGPKDRVRNRRLDTASRVMTLHTARQVGEGLTLADGKLATPTTG